MYRVYYKRYNGTQGVIGDILPDNVNVGKSANFEWFVLDYLPPEDTFDPTRPTSGTVIDLTKLPTPQSTITFQDLRNSLIKV